jgi:hypothetical protein
MPSPAIVESVHQGCSADGHCRAERCTSSNI